MDDQPTVPEIALPDYTTISPEASLAVLEKIEEKYSSPALIAKVRKRTIKGRIIDDNQV